MKHPGAKLRFFLIGILVFGPALVSIGADTTNAPVAASKAEDATNSDTLRAYLELQEQVHATQIAIERNRQEAEAAAARNADLLANRLQLIEQSLAQQRTHELEMMQNANRTMLIVAGTFAAAGILAMLFTTYFQWRAATRFAQIAALMPAGRGVGPARISPELDGGESQVMVGAPAETNTRLLGAIERLEKRILELEHIAVPPLSNGVHPAGESNGGDQSSSASQITMLLGKGQSLLNLDKFDEATACFDEALALEPNNAEVLVKKGVTLERQRKLDEAIEYYDRAIAADGSMTIAYLYKGGVCNRLERFGEALQCYERALHTQEKTAA